MSGFTAWQINLVAKFRLHQTSQVAHGHCNIPVYLVRYSARAASGVGQTKSCAQDWGCQAFRKGMKGTRSRRVTRGSSSLIAILKWSVASCAAHPASLT